MLGKKAHLAHMGRASVDRANRKRWKQTVKIKQESLFLKNYLMVCLKKTTKKS